ncbi:Phosphoribosyl 1,2-cyclic phosphate phosphodiesterase [bacterium HR40]|nr:Phosphoribosyl 1,2-cyclic phosphate phosphodiesterase [bacterium HR40]
MRVIVLGCGTSAGVPQIGCDCAVCRSSDPRNHRRRCALYIEVLGQRILVDTGPDLRMQCLDAGIAAIDALIYTHGHADHLHGIDDLRQINNLIGRPIPTYAHPEVFARIRERFGYVFEGGRSEFGFWRPELEAHEVGEGPFAIGPVPCLLFRQKHGRGSSFGLRIGGFAYSTDTDGLAPEVMAQLRDLEVWIVDALRERPHPSHAHLALTLSWIRELEPRRAYLTHMNHEVDYASWLAKLPANVEPAYDGLVIELPDPEPSA